MPTTKIRETDLYAPIKLLLEGQGYSVKSEIGSADVVAVRDADDPVIVELKTGFSLSLFHQAIDRQSLTDTVYIAVPHGTGRPFSKSIRNNKALCRRLGLGLITVRMKDGHVVVHIDPAPYKPHQSKQKKARLLREFAKRVGDPNTGGATRRGLMTAYRQDALLCVKILHETGPAKGAQIAQITNIENATRLMGNNHYGWFERVQFGVYTLSPKGLDTVNEYSNEIKKLSLSLKQK